MMRNNNERRIQHSQVNEQTHYPRYKYTDQTEVSSRRSHLPNIEKQNSIRSTNLPKLSPSYPDQAHVKSTSSTHQQTHPKTSTDNLHALRLQSQILELQKTLDEQQFEIETLTEQASHFMKLCDEQKEILIQLNIEGMRSEYQEQVDELLAQRQKVQQIIMQLQDDYNEVYMKQQLQLNALRDRNDQISKQIDVQLQRKKSLLSLVATKDKQLICLQIDLRQSEERIDELRNIQRKLTIALKELEMVRTTNHTSANEVFNRANTDQIHESDRQRYPRLSPEKQKGMQNTIERRKSQTKYQYQFYKNQ